MVLLSSKDRKDKEKPWFLLHASEVLCIEKLSFVNGIFPNTSLYVFSVHESVSNSLLPNVYQLVLNFYLLCYFLCIQIETNFIYIPF